MMTHRVFKSYSSNMSMIYVHICVVKKPDNVPSLSLSICQWPYGNSCTWAHDVELHIAGTSEPKSAQQDRQGA